MATEDPTPRSRRAILAAAAGAAGAIAASAALPLTAAAADPDDVVKGVDNPTTTTTSITDSGPDSTAFAANATGPSYGFGLVATSAHAAGVFAWSNSHPSAYWTDPDNPFTVDLTDHVGVFGSSPEGDGVNIFGAGVWGDSPDTGVYGSGSYGVEGYGGVGVAGYAYRLSPGTVGVWAESFRTDQTALRVVGKASFSRSGRKTMKRGTKTKTVYLAGTTASSKVFAVLATSEYGRWVRAVVPAAGKFTIYLNTTLASSAVVSWFVLD